MSPSWLKKTIILWLIISISLFTTPLFAKEGSGVILSSTGENYIPKVDFAKVQQARLDRHNKERTSLGKTGYTINAKLNTTGKDWAEHLASLNYSTHKRKSTDGYYNYSSIKDWFWTYKISFPKEKKWAANFTENIAYQYYTCNKDDCTQDLINALKKGFAFFMSEKSKKWKPHYNAIISPYFTQIGMGIGFVGKKYFVVTHYVTKIE